MGNNMKNELEAGLITLALVSVLGLIFLVGLMHPFYVGVWVLVLIIGVMIGTIYYVILNGVYG